MKKKKIIIIAGISLFVVLSAGIFAITRGLSCMKYIEPAGINPTLLSDGSYTGTFEHGRFTNTLTVRIEGGRIIAIDIDDDLFGGSVLNVSDEVFDRVIRAQDTRIDTVAGSTVTTTAYLKAIEDALTRGAE